MLAGGNLAGRVELPPYGIIVARRLHGGARVTSQHTTNELTHRPESRLTRGWRGP
jgi:hypothetical protein